MALSPFPPLCHFTPSTTYNFTYGAFDLRTGVSVGTQELATYTYSNDRKYNLQKLDYGNGDSVQYTYDDQDRVIKQTYENGDYISYFYNNDGDLAKVYDSQTGITTTYTYDLSGRLVEYRETGDGHDYSLTYTYDKENQITNVMEIVDGHDRESTYRYNTDGQITFFEKVLARREYNYDAFGRVSATDTQGKSYDTVYTTDYTYNDTATTASGQVAGITHDAAHYDKTLTYTYDGNGNILSVSDGTNTTTYVYDGANQLIRENNQAGNFTHTWTYDAAGNILTRNEYAYTTGELGEPTDTVTYTYGDTNWKDKLTAYGGTAITYDNIGNPLSDGAWNYTWEHGRQLASMTDGTTTWNYTYGASGLRTNRTDGTTNYRYFYEGSQLIQMSRNSLNLRFAYSPEGTPISVTYKNTTYYYVTNIQGDVIAILSQNGYVMAEYTYDAWGNVLSITGSLANTLGQYNPLRYRGYVYDVETGLYYLQSRYYDPEWGRFINADGQLNDDILGNNLFAYCGNNPVLRTDLDGQGWWIAASAIVGGLVGAAAKVVSNVMTGNKWNTGVIGAAVGGAMYGGVLAATGSVVAAGFASAASEAAVNELLSYTPLAKVNGYEQKDVSTENVVSSVATVVADTAINGTASAVTGKVAGMIVPTNNGWFQPQKLASSFVGKYAIKSQLQTYVQAGLLIGVEIVRSTIDSYYRKGQTAIVTLFS